MPAKRWRATCSIVFGDLKRLKSLVGIVVGALAVLTASVAFLRAQLPAIGDRWAWGIVGIFVATQLAWYVALAYVRAKTESAGGSEHDNRLLDRALELLPSDSDAMRFLCEGSFEARFERSQIEPLKRFAREFRAPERAFHDNEVEGAKQALIKAWDDLHSLLSRNVFVDPRSEDDRLGTAYALDYPGLQGTGIPEADQAYEVALELDSRASRVCDAHREFIAVAVRRIRA